MMSASLFATRPVCISSIWLHASAIWCKAGRAEGNEERKLALFIIIVHMAVWALMYVPAVLLGDVG